VKSTGELHFWPTRVALSYFDLPAGVTRAGYAAGQKLGSVWPGSGWGDYKLLTATKPNDREDSHGSPAT